MICVKTLRAAGLSDTEIVRVIEADQAANAERDAATRERKRINQRNYRERKKFNDINDRVISSPVTLEKTNNINDRVIGHNGHAPTLYSDSFLESESIKKESKKERVGRVGKHLLPEDWQPNSKHYAKGPKHLVDQQAETMRNWAHAKGIMRVDWDAQFHAFLKPQDGFVPVENTVKREFQPTPGDGLLTVEEIRARRRKAEEAARTSTDLLANGTSLDHQQQNGVGLDRARERGTSRVEDLFRIQRMDPVHSRRT